MNLKACPFCGCGAQLICRNDTTQRQWVQVDIEEPGRKDGTRYQVECLECNTRGPDCTDKDVVVRIWNCRVPPVESRSSLWDAPASHSPFSMDVVMEAVRVADLQLKGLVRQAFTEAQESGKSPEECQRVAAKALAEAEHEMQKLTARPSL